MKSKLMIASAIVGAALMTSTSAQARSWDSLQCGDNWGPTKRGVPTYPRRAQQRGIEGTIELSFSLSTEGSIEDVEVIDGSNIFARSAMQALTETEFPPCIQNGVATEQANLSVRYDFNLQ